MADDYSGGGSSSDSDSGSSGGSDSGSGGVSGWDVAGALVGSIIESWDSPGSAPTSDWQRREAAEAERRRAWDNALRALFIGPSGAKPPPLPQAIVERDEWFVPVRADGSFELIVAREREYGLAIEVGPKRREQGRRTVRGKGGRLLPIFDKAPKRPVVALDGRALVRALSDSVDGLLLQPKGEKPRELGREHFAELRRRADEYDATQRKLAAGRELEAMLLEPGPDQAERLLRATWWVQRADWKEEPYTPHDSSALVVRAFTHPSRSAGSKLASVNGAALFERLADDQRLDGVIVNLGSAMGKGEAAVNGLALSPGFACGLLRGEDIRPGARPLPARGRQEVQLWLDLHGFPSVGRELTETPLPDGLLVRATSGPVSSYWRLQETLHFQRARTGPFHSPEFVLPPSAGPDEGFGDGPSRILCAGQLAIALNGASYRWHETGWWRPGRWLGPGCLLDEADRAQSARRVMLAEELIKLLSPGTDQVPRSAIRTVYGASVLRKNAGVGRRAWIEAVQQRAARYTKRWVWFG